MSSAVPSVLVLDRIATGLGASIAQLLGEERASAATVNSGAIDPLAALRALCDRYGLWLHVDGAYGAPAILSTGDRPELEPIALADSVVLDPHKWLYVPVETGLVLVRDGQAMRDTFSLVPA